MLLILSFFRRPNLSSFGRAKFGPFRSDQPPPVAAEAQSQNWPTIAPLPLHAIGWMMFVISKQLNSNCRHRENLGRKLCVAPSGRGGTNFGVTCNAQITTHWSVCWVQLCNVVVFRDESLNFSNCARTENAQRSRTWRANSRKTPCASNSATTHSQRSASFFFRGGSQ